MDNVQEAKYIKCDTQLSESYRNLWHVLYSVQTKCLQRRSSVATAVCSTYKHIFKICKICSDLKPQNKCNEQY